MDCGRPIPGMWGSLGALEGREGPCNGWMNEILHHLGSPKYVTVDV